MLYMPGYRRRKHFLYDSRVGDPKELDNYLQSDLFEVLLGTKNFLSEPCEIKFYTVSSTTGIEAVKKARGKIS